MSSACDNIAHDLYVGTASRRTDAMDSMTPKSPHALEDFICFSVYSASHAFNRVYRPLLDQLGLTYPQYLVMTLLWREDGRSVKDIGHELQLESSTLTPLLKRLEALRLIARRRDGADERVVRITLTDQGRAMAADAAHVPRCILEATGASEREIADLTIAINKIRDRLARLSED